MTFTTKLSKDTFGKNIEQKFYRSMIGSLLYLIAICPNISFSVGVCARYQTNPKKSHLMSIRRIIRYINGTFDYGLWYPYDSSLKIVGYFNIDKARNVEDRRSRFGACFFIGDCLMAWWLGLVRNKTLYLYLLSKLSILLLGAIVCNSYG